MRNFFQATHDLEATVSRRRNRTFDNGGEKLIWIHSSEVVLPSNVATKFVGIVVEPA